MCGIDPVIRFWMILGKVRVFSRPVLDDEKENNVGKKILVAGAGHELLFALRTFFDVVVHHSTLDI